MLKNSFTRGAGGESAGGAIPGYPGAKLPPPKPSLAPDGGSALSQPAFMPGSSAILGTIGAPSMSMSAPGSGVAPPPSLAPQTPQSIVDAAYGPPTASASIYPGVNDAQNSPALAPPRPAQPELADNARPRGSMMALRSRAGNYE